MSDRTLIILLTGLYSSAIVMALICTRALVKEKDRSRRLAEVVLYLATMIEEYEIDIDEFDMIALRAIWEGNNATK